MQADHPRKSTEREAGMCHVQGALRVTRSVTWDHDAIGQLEKSYTRLCRAQHRSCC